ncbi:hypothetical protein BDB01DRAFT_190725 [Pilobolus umbonatus]|nr:hypothetical protein BDB01DRAFT_190725 [Pilobolus umbonatus]
MSFELDTLSYTLLASIVGATTLLSIRNSKRPDVHPLLLNTQSDVSCLRHPGETAVYRSRMQPMGTPLTACFDRSIRTMADFYKECVLKKHNTSSFLMNDHLDLGYDEVRTAVSHFYKGLQTVAHLTPQSGDESSFVAIFSPVSANTFLTEIACHTHGLVTIPISSTATSTYVSHVIKKTSVKVLVVDSLLLDQALSCSKHTSIQYIIVYGDVTAEHKKTALGHRIELLSFEEVLAKGKDSTIGENVEVVSSDIISLYFNSSLDKESKHGVVLTHKNVLSVISSYILVIPPHQKISAKDRLVLTLPIDNVLGYVLSAVMAHAGGSIAYCREDEDDIQNTLSTIAKIKPTILVSGPVFYHQLKDLVETRYGQSFLFKRGYNVKSGYLEEGRLVNDCKYDMLVFRDIRQRLLGGNIRLMFIDNDDTTDGTLAPFMRIVFSAQVLETFNLTESCSTVTAAMFYDYQADPDSKGAPLPCNEIKLVDATEYSLTAEDKPNPRGYIWIRGNNIFNEYYKEVETTLEILDSDGWLMTPYLGEILPNGTIKVIGRA